jgi:hypothetical protein
MISIDPWDLEGVFKLSLSNVFAGQCKMAYEWIFFVYENRVFFVYTWSYQWLPKYNLKKK